MQRVSAKRRSRQEGDAKHHRISRQAAASCGKCEEKRHRPRLAKTVSWLHFDQAAAAGAASRPDSLRSSSLHSDPAALHAVLLKFGPFTIEVVTNGILIQGQEPGIIAVLGFDLSDEGGVNTVQPVSQRVFKEPIEALGVNWEEFLNEQLNLLAARSNMPAETYSSDAILAAFMSMLLAISIPLPEG